VALLAAIAGLILSYPLVELGLGRWMEENMGNFFPAVRISPLTALTAVAFTLGLGALAAVIPAVAAGRLQVTEALRRVG
jgi:putative ABC transport system permease protein